MTCFASLATHPGGAQSRRRFLCPRDRGDRSRAATRLHPAPVVVALACVLSLATAVSAREPNVITPEFAQSVFDGLRQLHEADDCRLERVDTSRTKMTIAWRDPLGAEAAADIAFVANDWKLLPVANGTAACAATFTAARRVLGDLGEPPAPVETVSAGAENSVAAHRAIERSFLVLILGTLYVLVREAWRGRPPAPAVVALVAISVAALFLRLYLSPRTFLHEFFHVAETIAGYLEGRQAPVYGETGPALFQFVARTLGWQQDVRVIFLTNAVLSSLAVPAVGLLTLLLLGSWAPALCAAALLCVLPQHLRFSAAEDLFVQALTFGLWATALFALYLRGGRLEDAVLAAVGLAIAMQTRPEMMVLPAALIALVAIVQPHRWRILVGWRSLLALGLAAILLVPRLRDVWQVVHEPAAPAAHLPRLGDYWRNLVLFDPDVTPRWYWLCLLAGGFATLLHAPRVLLWVGLVYFGFTLFSTSMFMNTLYNLRSQIPPTSLTVIIAAGIALPWVAAWRDRRRAAAVWGAAAVIGVGALTLHGWQGFITKLYDQQLQWAFLQRTVPDLPEGGTLLSAIEPGGFNLDSFPTFLLRGAGKAYQTVDLRSVAKGGAPWPSAEDGSLLFYQGMYCYFAVLDEPTPDPMTEPCQEVARRYTMEPLYVADLRTEGYSLLRYARDGKGPYQIGFFRLRGQR